MNRVLFSIVIALSICLANCDYGFDKICKNALFMLKGQEVNTVFWQEVNLQEVNGHIDEDIIDKFMMIKKRLNNGYPIGDHMRFIIGRILPNWEKIQEEEKYKHMNLILNKTADDFSHKQIVSLQKLAINGVEDFNRDTFKRYKKFYTCEMKTKLHLPVNDEKYTPIDDCKQASELPGFFSKKGKKSSLIDLLMY